MDKKKLISTYIVDSDENYLYKVVKELKCSETIDVIGTATNASNAFEEIRVKRPQVIVTDLILLGFDGIELLTRIRKQMPADYTPRIIVVSTVNSNSIVQRALSLGAEYYMLKPVNTLLLRARIQELLEELPIKQPTEVAISVTTGPTTNSIEEYVTNLLLDFGMPTHIKGFKYTRKAILLALDNPDLIEHMTKGLYIDVANAFGTTSSRTERAIRHAIECTYDNGNYEMLDKFFRHSVNQNKGKPTNSHFISRLVDHISLKF